MGPKNEYYRGPPPQLLHGPAWAFHVAHDFFGYHFLDIILALFFSHFVANLASTWPPTWPQDRPKIDKKSNHFLDWFLSWFFNQFWSIFDRFWPPKSTKNWTKIDQESNPTTQQWKKENIQKPLKSLRFLMVFWGLPCDDSNQNRQKIYQNRLQDLSKNQS